MCYVAPNQTIRVLQVPVSSFYITEVFPAAACMRALQVGVLERVCGRAHRRVWRHGGRVLWLVGIMPAPAQRWAELCASSSISPSITEQSDRPDNTICCCISRISPSSPPPSHPLLFLPSLPSPLLFLGRCPSRFGFLLPFTSPLLPSAGYPSD